MNLKTERLKLYPFDTGDLKILHDTFTDPFVRKYLWDDEIITIEQTKDILKTNKQNFSTKNWGLWKVLLKSDCTYVGFVGLWIFFDENQPQLIYGILPTETKKGYATEASRAVLIYAFEHLNFEYVSASFDSIHDDSKKVCERLEMKHTKDEEINGIMTSFYRIDRDAESLGLVDK